jgi:hypothetical protein
VDPREGELAHLRFLDEEVAEEQRRHERTMRNLDARRRRAEHRLALIDWRAQRPVE